MDSILIAGLTVICMLLWLHAPSTHPLHAQYICNYSHAGLGFVYACWRTNRLLKIARRPPWKRFHEGGHYSLVNNAPGDIIHGGILLEECETAYLTFNWGRWDSWILSLQEKQTTKMAESLGNVSLVTALSLWYVQRCCTVDFRFASNERVSVKP